MGGCGWGWWGFLASRQGLIWAAGVLGVWAAAGSWFPTGLPWGWGGLVGCFGGVAWQGLTLGGLCFLKGLFGFGLWLSFGTFSLFLQANVRLWW